MHDPAPSTAPHPPHRTRRPSVRAGAAPALALLLAAAALTACGGSDTEPPAAPAGLTAQAGSATTVHVMWLSPAPSDGVTSFLVYQADRLVRELPADKTMTDITGLTPRTAYAFTVRARDAAGNTSPAGPAASATTPAATAEDRRAPTAPPRTNGQQLGPTSARLTWAAATDDTGVTAYDVYQGDARIHTVGPGVTTTVLEDLQPDSVYTFTVRARDGADNSSPDGPAVDVRTPPGPGQRNGTAPGEFTAAASPGTVTLTWTAPATGRETSEYELYVNGRPTTVIQFGAGAVPAGRAEHRLTVAEPPGTVWTLKLRARLPDGTWGAFSAERRIVLAA
ncbi:fibronectin type III domain-containing protein [Streptomyces sp. NBC_01264]|uniref:fibronectin type III domain-containing protein n=1 Tax=Streptomyces sp. NBC_01264 TaxID=2903804 RepID=UPI002258581D|nr:fibronectin type III domain-containing protein [Streptomyces sp. NBC_01264]MCX4776687.1 fibronectin type III domain-containing protein [Streptomyces sp. NBC_01264]